MITYSGREEGFSSAITEHWPGGDNCCPLFLLYIVIRYTDLIGLASYLSSLIGPKFDSKQLV